MMVKQYKYFELHQQSAMIKAFGGAMTFFHRKSRSDALSLAAGRWAWQWVGQRAGRRWVVTMPTMLDNERDGVVTFATGERRSSASFLILKCSANKWKVLLLLRKKQKRSRSSEKQRPSRKR